MAGGWAAAAQEQIDSEAFTQRRRRSVGNMAVAEAGGSSEDCPLIHADIMRSIPTFKHKQSNIKDTKRPKNVRRSGTRFQESMSIGGNGTSVALSTSWLPGSSAKELSTRASHILRPFQMSDSGLLARLLLIGELDLGAMTGLAIRPCSRSFASQPSMLSVGPPSILAGRSSAPLPRIVP